jgi:NAD(P)-dependent dehydrogenase (short-subunit alcohol dehydrogenase family)
MHTQSPFARLDMSGKVVLVTGGGSGLGAATAELVATRGAAVMIADRNGPGAAETVETIEQAGGRAAYVETDITQPEAVEALVAATVSKFGRLDGAFNNAGVASKGVPLEDVTVEDWQFTIDINLKGIFLCVKYEAPAMFKNGGGSIVNMSSAMGSVSVPNIVDYASSKSGVLGLTRVASTEFSSRGIRVNAVQPGAIKTPLLAPALEDPAMKQAMESGHPIGRYGEPYEVAETVAFLLSDASSFVTGTSILIDGGYVAI